MPKSLSEVASFMQKEWLAGFATVDAEGLPHVVPVFFTYNQRKVYVQTDRKSTKVRNLTKNSNAVIAVYRGEEAVIITGKGKIITDRNEFIKRNPRAH